MRITLARFMFLFLPISHSPIPSFHILYSNSLQWASANEEWVWLLKLKGLFLIIKLVRANDVPVS